MKPLLCSILMLVTTIEAQGEDEPVVLRPKELVEVANAPREDRDKLRKALADKYAGKTVRFTGYVYQGPIKLRLKEGLVFKMHLTTSLKGEKGSGMTVNLEDEKDADRLSKWVYVHLLVTVEGKARPNSQGSIYIAEAKVVDVEKKGKR